MPKQPNSDQPELPLGGKPEPADAAVPAPSSAPAVPAPAAPTPTAATPATSAPTLKHVDGLFETWFIEYASYVILDRAVPHIDDGLKPVQRRIMHSLHELEDGRYNKVANAVGNTMKYHPHGDASITDALVGLGQKELLIDTQGNWGNIITGDPAAAPRYIEARLSKFALEAVFNPKTTVWTKSYDERNDEPVTLPIKFPLLLAQGVEGIAVGLSCKVLPHNFNEIIDASIAILRGKHPTLFPDFLTGGLADCTDYQDGKRGGKVRVRAKIEIRSPQLLAITEIPFGTIVPNLIASIVAAHQKEKIKIKKVDDNTSEHAEILIHLLPGSDPKTVKNALYAFTECEILIHPNAVVIFDQKPSFTSVSEILRISTERTRDLLKRELEIRLGELNARWHTLSLEKIFIEKKIYQRIENCETWESILSTIDAGLAPYTKHLKEPVTPDDCAHLTEIKIKRISRWNSRTADDDLKKIVEAIKETQGFLAQLTAYAISWFQGLKKKYGKGRERRTELTTFSAISAASVAHANVKPFVNKKEGFIGWGLKRDEDAEPLGECSDLDEVMAIARDGSLKVNKVAEKDFFGAEILHATLFIRGDTSTTYNVIYERKEGGGAFAKRFHMGDGVIRDRIYPVAGGKILFLGITRTPDEAPKVQITLRDRPGLRKREFDFDFATLAIKNRTALGNNVSKYKIQKVVRAR
jgi:topoisomerase-4 subunit A